jgi:hypothetical protein
MRGSRRRTHSPSLIVSCRHDSSFGRILRRPQIVAAMPRQEIRGAAADLMVVAIFGIRGVEVRGVALSRRIEAEDRRVDDRRAGAADVSKTGLFLRVLRLDKELFIQGAPIARHELAVWIIGDADGCRIDRVAERRRVRTAGIAQVLPGDGVIVRDRRREIDLTALVLVVNDVGNAG